MNNAANPARFFDQLVAMLERGRAEEALLVLAGALDGVVLGGGDTDLWRSEFTGHPLSEEIARITNEGLACGAIQELGFARALQSREELLVAHIKQAAMQGKAIRLCDDASRRLAARIPCQVTSRGFGADVLVAVGLADHLHGHELAGELQRLAGGLAKNGSILISSFVPGHIGLGWQLICGGQRLHCHDEAAFETAASQTGLTLTHFRDASDSLVWAIFRQPSENNYEKDMDDGQ